MIGGDDGVLPSKIWGFLDMSDLAHDSGVNYGGLSNIQPGTYAIVETGNGQEIPNDYEWSIFSPFCTEVTGDEDNEADMGTKLYLADVEAFKEPVCVIPDIGGRINAYFGVENMMLWSKKFVTWLNERHQDIDDAY